MSDVKPALTAEEWGQVEERPGGAMLVRHSPNDAGYRYAITVRTGERHALAALCLKDQPFGFTWEMVDMCRRRAEALRVTEPFNRGHCGIVVGDAHKKAIAAWDHLADTIEALLPPRDEP